MRGSIGISRIAIAAVIANTAAAHAASASPSDLCVFLNQVVAARAGEFLSLKGEPDTRVEAKYYRFHGTLASKPADDCTVSPRHETHDVGVAVAPSYYECVIASGAGFDALEAGYTAGLADIKACYPRWRYSERRLGERGDRTEDWELVGEGPRLQLRMVFFDHDVFRRGDVPDLKLTVSVTGVGPARKGGAQ